MVKLKFGESLGITEESLEKVKRGVFDVVTTKITNEDINSFLSEADEQLSKGIEVGKT